MTQLETGRNLFLTVSEAGGIKVSFVSHHYSWPWRQGKAFSTYSLASGYDKEVAGKDFLSATDFIKPAR
jgi:hypothetical protein